MCCPFEVFKKVLPDSLRVRDRIYKLSAALMKFYIARKTSVKGGLAS
jgi:hypothetical protein